MYSMFANNKQDSFADNSTRGVRLHPRGSSSDIFIVRLASSWNQAGRVVEAGYVRVVRPEPDDGQADVSG